MGVTGGKAGVLVALVVGRADTVRGGGVPIFIHEDPEIRLKVATGLAKIVRGMVHQLEDGTYVIARH